MAWSTALWLACAPALTTSFVATAVAAYALRREPVVTVALFPVAVLALLLRLRLSSAGARARIRSGHSPLGCFCAPRTPAEFAEQLCATWRATGRRPSVVGSGWGWLIARTRASDAVFTHRLKGRLGHVAEATFLAGTELRDVERSLRESHGRTFWSTPSLQRISIGSWLGRSCHGNSGAKGKPSSLAAARVLVVDLTSLIKAQEDPLWCDYHVAKHKFDRFPGQYAIAAVKFDVGLMTEDIWLQKARCDVVRNTVETTLELRKWLTPDAVLRVLFIGSARRVGIGVTYVEFDPADDLPQHPRCCGACGKMVPHVDPHDCSAGCMSMQLDTCSLVCGWYQRSKKAWTGIIRLSDANRFSPDPSWLVFPMISLLSGTVNFELFFKLQTIELLPTPRAQEFRVQKLCNSLLDAYGQFWGRSEVRIGDLKIGLVFVDCSVRKRDAKALVAALAPHVHAKTVAMHDAKYQGESVKRAIKDADLTLKTPRVLFGMAK